MLSVSADIVNRVVDIAKTLLIPSYRYVFDETSGSSSENIKIWLTEHILIKSLEYDTMSLILLVFSKLTHRVVCKT
jgi:hypothetical protein